MTKEREALRMALEALEIGKPLFDAYWGGSQFDQAITAIKEALNREAMDSSPNGEAQPEQRNASEHLEPVGEIGWAANIPNTIREVNWTELCPPVGTKLYTTPPQQSAIARSSSATPLKPLTDEEIDSLRSGYQSGRIGSFVGLCRAIEAAHGITASEAEDSQQRSKT